MICFSVEGHLYECLTVIEYADQSSSGSYSCSAVLADQTVASSTDAVDINVLGKCFHGIGEVIQIIVTTDRVLIDSRAYISIF